MCANLAVIFHSIRGTGHQLATEMAAGARAAGAAVRLAQVPDETAQISGVPVAAPEDLLWSDGIVFGTPTYYGNVSASFKRFVDSTSPLWRLGLLADRAVTAFTSSTTPHGGREGTLLAVAQCMCHWGCVLVPTGEPRGAAFGLAVDARRDGNVADEDRVAARAVGHRMTEITTQLRGFAAETGMSSPRIAVVYHSSSGRTAVLADAVAAVRPDDE